MSKKTTKNNPRKSDMMEDKVKTMKDEQVQTTSDEHQNQTIMKVLIPWMENLTSLIKSGFEKHLELLQAEIYLLRKDVDAEKEKRKHLERLNEGLSQQMTFLANDLNDMEEKIDKVEQEKRSNDVVIENVEKLEVSDPGKHMQELINTTLMGKVVEDGDIIKTFIIPNKRNPTKMTLIGKFKNDLLKKAILAQRKMFIAKNMFPKENLTPYRYRIYTAARKFSKEKGFRFVWTHDANVFLRKDEASPKILVTNKTVFENL